ncbi:TetR/AcrR family transcriptional regulator [Novosphingobium album (ex Liu et al. 2023)]|uniref:TetR/AcrR family transcriptional regulator n=1 Tax=Novosphingobium album (ex Liu et al. 2023) TaxID=3031130 RepID=A0ABT5WUD1_9SPHN|nr:TetR/AcrR family transcriptional regulator [Novosphingobium album (ex Liu et al. 2023)]MDE8653474.1 TetR/AcrR family transcriptional regulator [Novosphingobium album (ex Liu et al. 2023)]
MASKEAVRKAGGKPLFPPAPGIATGTGANLVSHNLNGQRLGPKGRETRERILAAAIELIESSEEEMITLSAVAQRASLRMTSLYNYFSDLTELIIAILEPVAASAEAAYLAQLRPHWPDDEIYERCYAFVFAYHAFWVRHSRLLHLRNTISDHRDRRMMMRRIDAARPIVDLLVRQMNATLEPGGAALSMATLLMTGIERSFTIVTDRQLPRLIEMNIERPERYLEPSARLLEFAIRDMRARVATGAEPG